MREEIIISPRLAALARALEAREPGALDAFWLGVAEQGTPLVEPVAGDDGQVLLTFVWRATEPVDNVLVVGGPAGWDMVTNRMARLAGTDVWYLTCRVANGARTTYRLAPDDPLTSLDDAPDWKTRTRGWRPDPLNPSTFVFPRDEEIRDDERVVSVIELPGAPPQRWITPRSGVDGGTVTKHRVRSEILRNDRRVWVYTPPGYTSDAEPYRLLLLFDGGACIRLIPAPTILDNLLAEGCIPPVVAVLIDSLSQKIRDRELQCHPPFVSFLAQELLPWVRERYHVTSDSAHTIVAGQSYGGLAAAYAALRHPQMFGNVLSQSGSFWWRPDGEGEHEWLARQYADAPTLPLRFYLEVGLLECSGTPGGGPDQVVANRHLCTVLRAKGCPVHYAEYNGGHDYLCWRGTLGDGLIALAEL